MKESKGVYVTKHDIREDQLNRNYQLYTSKITRDYRYEGRTRDAGVQYNYRRDNVICTCRNISSLRRHHEVRYFSGYPKHVYAYHGSRSFTDIGVGNVKPYPRKKVKRIYLPETNNRGVGSSDLSSFISRKTRYYRTSFYDHKSTSSKCVGGVLEGNTEVLNEKLSPIVHTKSGTTSPGIPTTKESKKNVEIGSNTHEKSFVTISTQIQDGDIKIEEIVKEVKVATVIIKQNETKEISKQSNKEQKFKEGIATSTDEPRPKRISKRAQEAERVFSSDSLVQHVHNLEHPSEDKVGPLDPMENKLEREYRKMFSTKSKDSKEQKTSSEGKPDTLLKSTSVLRRRFEALRRGLAKKDDAKKNAALTAEDSSHVSAPSHKDVSIASDPPSLEARSYSNTKVYSPRDTDQDVSTSRTVYRKSFTGRKDWSRPEDEDSEQGVKGMFKLWGKKFNLEDEESSPGPSLEISKKPKDKMAMSESDSKKEGKKFFFFKKKSKDKPKQQPYKQKKGVTAGRCEVGDGLMIKIGAANNPPPEKERKELEKVPEVYEEILRKAWLQQFLAQTIDSRPSVKIRWNNNAYATSSSTVFEIMENVYKDTGVVFRSKSEVTTGESSFYKSFTKQHVNFVQDIEAWMMPRFIPDHATPTVRIRKDENGDKNDNIEVRISDQKWLIDKSKAFAQKINIVLHSKNIVRPRKDPSSEYLRIDIPKGFFTDSSSDSTAQMQTSNEEVFKIVEYESPEYNNYLKTNRNIEIGDHLNDIKVTDSVKISREFESKILETVLKTPPIQRDVGIQGSTVYIPKKCNVISVGIITQKDITKLRKPILKIQEDYSDDDSDRIHQTTNQSKFGESYVHEFYRNWTSLGIDFFSWCVSDTHLQSFNNQGDGTKSCPNIFDDYQASTMISSCGTSCCSHCAPWEEEEPKEKFVSKLLSKFRSKSKSEPPYQSGVTRVLPKDSVEVFKRRKLYAASNKSKWSCADDRPYSVPSIASRGAQDTLVECPKVKKTCYKPACPTEIMPKKKDCKKHVSLPDCDTMNKILSDQLADRIHPGILQFRGSSKCDMCNKNGAVCPKHPKIVPKATCEIQPPNMPCKEPPSPPKSLCSPPSPRKSPCPSPPKSPCSPPRTPSCGSPKMSGIRLSSPPNPPCPKPPKSPPCKKPKVCGTPPCTPPPPCKRGSPPCTPHMSKRKSPPCSTSPPCPPPTKRACPPSPPPCPPSPPCPTPKRKPTCPPSPRRQSPSPPRCPSSPPRQSPSPPRRALPPRRASPPRHRSPPQYTSSPPRNRSPCSTPPCSTIKKRLRTPSPPQCPSPPPCPTPPPNPTPRRKPCPPLPLKSRPSPPSCSPTPPSCPSPLKKKSLQPCQQPSCKKPIPGPKSQCKKASPSPSCRNAPKGKTRSRTPSPCTAQMRYDTSNPPMTPPIPPKSDPPTRDNSPPSTPPRPRSNSPKPSCDACKKCPSQEFPWPIKNQVSNQSLISVASHQTNRRQSAENPPICADPRPPVCVVPPVMVPKCIKGCSFLPPECPKPPPPPEPCHSPPKISGIFLKMKAARKTCSKECTAWESSSQCPDRSDSEDDITINIKKGTASTEEIREGINIKVQDEDGRTLYERCDYQKRPSVLNDMYKSNLHHHVSRSIVQNMAVEEKSDTELQEAKSEVSVANLIEINFKLKVTQGDNTTEINIGNDGVTAEKPKDTKNQIGQTSHAVFTLKDEAEQCGDEANDKNDINIKIVIKNYKPKKKNEINKKYCAEVEDFTQKISEKFQTVSTGYSDVAPETFEQKEQVETTEKNAEQVFSIHRATIDLTTSNEASKSQVATKDNLRDENITKTPIDLVSSQSATGKLGTEPSESKLKDAPSKKASEVEDISQYTYKDKPGTYYITDTDDQEATVDLDKASDDQNETTSNEKIGDTLTKQEKKTLMKKVFAKVCKSRKMKSKEKLQFKDMLKVILTSDSSGHEEMAVTSNELVKEMTYASLKPNYFRDTDSMNNYYKVDSSVISSIKGSDVRPNFNYPTENISQCSVVESDGASSEDDRHNKESHGCLCSTFAARLNMCSGKEGGGCCCRKPTKADEETCCDLRTEEDFFLLNYKTIEYIDVETQNSKFVCKSKNISVHSGAISGSIKNCINVRTVRDAGVTEERISKTFTPKPTHVKPCEMKTLNRNTILGISDEDKVYLMNTKPTKVSVRHDVSRVPRESHRKKTNQYDRPADVLQCYETKKAVLEIYAEKTLSEKGEKFVAKLPKFVINKESELERNYAEFSKSYRDLENFVMSVNR